MARGRRAVARLIHRIERPAVIPALRDQRVAFVSPMPPAPTGVATYSRAVLDGLGAIGYRRPIDVLWPVGPRDEVAVRTYGLAVYHIGNNLEFHGEIYRFAIARPGIVVLHDLGLDEMVRGLLVEGDPAGHRAWREAARRAPSLSLPEARIHEPLSQPWCAHVVRHSRGVIVHSEFARSYVEDFGCRTPVFVVPHPPVESDRDVRVAVSRAPAMRTRAGARAEDVLVVAPGDLNAAKQLDAVAAAVARLPEGTRLVLAGRSIPGYDAVAAIRAAGIGDRALVAADVSDADFRAWIAAADVVVDLRYPHRGETSGSLARALQAGRACVVSATGAYLDLGDAVATVPPGPVDPRALATVLGELAGDADRRTELGARARALAGSRYSLEVTARGYERAIERTLALALDPVRLALPRWARALNDVGVSQDDVDEGIGVSYVRGLQELAAEIPARARPTSLD